MTKTAAKRKAQDLILAQLAKIGYGDEYEEFVAEVGDEIPDGPGGKDVRLRPGVVRLRR